MTKHLSQNPSEERSMLNSQTFNLNPSPETLTLRYKTLNLKPQDRWSNSTLKVQWYIQTFDMWQYYVNQLILIQCFFSRINTPSLRLFSLFLPILLNVTLV